MVCKASVPGWFWNNSAENEKNIWKRRNRTSQWEDEEDNAGSMSSEVRWPSPLYLTLGRLDGISIADRCIHSFIHSGYFNSAPSSPLLLRGAPDYNTDTVSEFHAKAHRQLQVKDLPKVRTWRLERESNPRPSGWKSSTQPMRHHVQHWLLWNRYDSLWQRDRRRKSGIAIKLEEYLPENAL